MAELSDRSGVAVPTIKFYLREGLLPRGEPRGATRSSYDESHVDRLRLIRALVDVAGLGLERVREVLDVLDSPSSSLHQALAAAHQLLSPAPEASPTEASAAAVAQLLAATGSAADPHGPHATAVAAALDAMHRAGQPVSDEGLVRYAQAMAAVAEAEVVGMTTEHRDGALTYALLGSVLAEPVLLGLRRLAHEDQSVRRFSG
ncbi:MerR family transcriptional regulator [Nocardioides hwasunensis]|uniref:MerR family transcriptional regulator n=1 Tax=Nocardioides hwasunensis TaxID=397258 RepID=A0ABR8MNX4_9ACTN|nr:MerR family transcriptional regulator [Nocardioides hwasunensis]MBD3916522.1 MerR family transcriptional regulator [Nocardioides hwasunensis]